MIFKYVAAEVVVRKLLRLIMLPLKFEPLLWWTHFEAALLIVFTCRLGRTSRYCIVLHLYNFLLDFVAFPLLFSDELFVEATIRLNH